MSIFRAFLFSLLTGLVGVTATLAQAPGAAPGGAPGGGMPAGMETEAVFDSDVIERKRPSRWKKPARETPAEQLAHAEALEKDDRQRKARKAFNALVHTWHDTPQAVTSQLAVARLYEEAGKYEKSFEQYQYLVEYYAGRFPYEQLLNRQFAIANLMRTRRTGKLLGFKGFKHDAKAVDMLEKLVENGPRWDRTPEAQLMIGMIYEDQKARDDAIFAYEVLQSRYRGSEAAMTAAFRAAFCRYHLAKRYHRDEESCRRAMSALAALARDYPTNPQREEAAGYLDELRENLAKMYFERATFYDRIRHKPKAAVVAYTEFMRRFPDSEQANIARDRVAELKLEMGPDDLAPLQSGGSGREAGPDRPVPGTEIKGTDTPAEGAAGPHTGENR